MRYTSLCDFNILIQGNLSGFRKEQRYGLANTWESSWLDFKSCLAETEFASILMTNAANGACHPFKET
ncbi:unnamed protein product [Coffea canephora]|uniref:Uncharacterized protein n=1 Tax=Coffea canephora TaxID=49390 RepID=A0A068U5F8_COFCA|nr:unnamed protein product [Coffea canephora]